MKNDARYLHWDEFRRRKMPAGFSVEECWSVLKTIRRASYREIDLHDPKGQPFVFGMPLALSAFLQQLDLGEGLASAARALDNSQTEATAKHERAMISTLVEEAITSSQLEGARTARALFYWAMLRTGYRLFGLISISQVILRAPPCYARAYLYTETDDNDLTYFILHQVEVIRAAIEERHKQHAKKARELQAVGRFLDKYPELNPRQHALLTHALREPSAAYEIYAHARSHGVTHQTARDDLFELVERGLLEASRRSRRYQFRPIKSLRSHLARLAAQ